MKSKAAIKATGFVLWELVELLFICYFFLAVFAGDINLERWINEQPLAAYSLALFFGGISFWISGAWVDKYKEYIGHGSKAGEVSRHN